MEAFIQRAVDPHQAGRDQERCPTRQCARPRGCERCAATDRDEQRAQGLQGWPIIQCHDELVAYTPDESEVPIIARAIKDSIEQPVAEMGGLIIPASIKVGKTWGHTEDYAG